VTLGAILYITIFVIGREGYNSIQVMAEQTILPPFKGMGNLGSSRFSLSRGFFALLGHAVTEETVIGVPLDMILWIRRNGLRVVAAETVILLTFDQVGYPRGLNKLNLLTSFNQSWLMAKRTQRLVISRMVCRERNDRLRAMTDRAVSPRRNGMGHCLRLA
jgi:hypothetical protein